MLSLLMCGGKGERLGMGEKPLVRVCGKRLVEHVLDSLWMCEVIAAVTDSTPETARFLKSEGIEVIKTSGKGYVEDMCQAIKEFRLFEPILVVSADLIFFKPVLLDVISAFISSDAVALTTAYPDGSYAGINVVDGMFIGEEQKEIVYRVEDNDVLNVNTPEDIKKAEEIWNTTRRGEEW